MVGIIFFQDFLILLVWLIISTVPFILATLHNMMNSHSLARFSSPLQADPNYTSFVFGQAPAYRLICAWSSLLVYECYYILHLFNILPN